MLVTAHSSLMLNIFSKYLLQIRCTATVPIQAITNYWHFRTHSFDDSNPRLARRKSGRRTAPSARRVSWHSGLELVDGFGVLNAIRSSPGEVLVSPIVIVSCPPSSSSMSLCPDHPGDPPPDPPVAPSPPSQPIQRSMSQTFTKERRSNSVTRSFRRIFAKSSGASNL